ncbi:hypothetical protein C0J52_22730 [Blattella germanica]|nr:hypothetical protein C0J52_22730 [Blattella germanica]
MQAHKAEKKSAIKLKNNNAHPKEFGAENLILIYLFFTKYLIHKVGNDNICIQLALKLLARIL